MSAGLIPTSAERTYMKVNREVYNKIFCGM